MKPPRESDAPTNRKLPDQLHLDLGGFPSALRPMLAMYAEAPFSSPDYLFEVKWDGLRCILFKNAAGRVLLQDRALNDITPAFPEVAQAAAQLAAGTVLDGELVVSDPEGHPDRQRLQRRLRGDAAGPIGSFLACDLLYAEGRPLLRQPLIRRRAHLARAVGPGDRILIPDHIESEGVDLFEACLEKGLQGMVAKHRDSRYIPGQRSPLWLQIEAVKRDDFVVVGWTPGHPFGALLVAYHEAGRLLPCGTVGGGYDDEVAHRLWERLRGLSSRHCPLEPEPIVTDEINWCRPELVVNVRYSEWAPDGTLRFPIFNSVSQETHPSECVRHRPRVVLEGRTRADGPAHSLTQFPF